MCASLCPQIVTHLSSAVAAVLLVAFIPQDDCYMAAVPVVGALSACRLCCSAYVRKFSRQTVYVCQQFNVPTCSKKLVSVKVFLSPYALTGLRVQVCTRASLSKTHSPYMHLRVGTYTDACESRFLG